MSKVNSSLGGALDPVGTSQHPPTITTTIPPTPLCWLLPDGQGCLSGVTCGEEGVCP